MTALLADRAIVSPVLPRRPQREADHHRPPVSRVAAMPSAWAHRPSVLAPASASEAAVIAPSAAVYQLTERGIAVILAVVALVVGAMVATLVTAYLSVSAAPPAAPTAPVVAAPLAAEA